MLKQSEENKSKNFKFKKCPDLPRNRNCKPGRDLKDDPVQLHSADREGDFPKVTWLIRAGLRTQLF